MIVEKKMTNKILSFSPLSKGRSHSLYLSFMFLSPYDEIQSKIFYSFFLVVGKNKLRYYN